MQHQAYDVEVSSARIAESRARVALADLEKNARVVQRRLAVVLHRSRLLLPQDRDPVPIDLDCEYTFDLADPDLVDMTIVPDFPGSREEAIQMAKRQRVEVRILVVGLRIAYLRNQGGSAPAARRRHSSGRTLFQEHHRRQPWGGPGCHLRRALQPAPGVRRYLVPHPPGPAGRGPISARPREVAGRGGQRCGQLVGPLAAGCPGMEAARKRDGAPPPVP